MNSLILLMIIDMQYDFCSPEGTLYVSGAENDVLRLADFITRNEDRIGHIILTQDYHDVIDISHPAFWEDRNGNHPQPYTGINLKKILAGAWQPRFHKSQAVEYIRKLETQGEYPHTIWPEHCIKGSRGAAIADEIMEPVKNWARKGRIFDVVIKGTHPLTEHFGALKANVPVAGSPETHLNTALAHKLITCRYNLHSRRSTKPLRGNNRQANAAPCRAGQKACDT
jgi:nicotinamidase/pyrazinamidase